MKKNILILAIFSISLVSCSVKPGPDKTIAGSMLGAAWGAGTGAAVGNQVNSSGEGAAIGAGIGLVGGAFTGAGLDITEEQELANQRQLDALQVQVASNQQELIGIQDTLDERAQALQNASPGYEIYFDADLASIRSGSAAQLQRVADSIKLNPYVGRVEIHGHSDDMGDTERNMRLSEARARTVATFLAQNGVSMDQISLVSHGAEQPVASNENDAGRQLNRRAEIVLLK